MARLKSSSPLLTCAVLRNLSCHQVAQRQGSGALYLVLPGHSLELGQGAQRSLLEWMEASRGWGKRKPLFTGGKDGRRLSLRGLEAALQRGRQS